MFKEIKAPNQIPTAYTAKKVFLAGTIDMGNSENWQEKISKLLENSGEDIIVLNPRRDDWDNSWKQEFQDLQFYQQVNWELNALDKADVIILYLLADSKSPISLLELGLYASSKKLLVVCPDEFYRSGNVHIVCDKYNIPLLKNIDELTKYLK